MMRRALLPVCLTTVFAWAFGAGAPDAARQAGAPGTQARSVTAEAGPIKLARHPDYHAGRVAFSYMGDIWTAREDGSDVRHVTDNTARETYPRFSPDGRWIAYDSGETGRSEVYIAPFPGPGRKWQVSPTGGFAPLWRGDGREIYFTNMDGKITGVELGATAGGLTIGAPRALFESTDLHDVSGDGRRFLVNRIPSAQTSEPLTLVLNWPAHLKK
jgi:hypothetical protein